MSFLVRAALLGGLAYVVSRAVRNSQHALDSSRSETQRLARTADLDEEDLTPSADLHSPTDVFTRA